MKQPSQERAAIALRDVAEADLRHSRRLAERPSPNVRYYRPIVPLQESDVLRGLRWVIVDELTRRLAGRAGWAVSMFREGVEAISWGAGYARMPWEAIGAGLPMTPTTRVHLASVSKIITSIGWFALREDWNR